MPHVQTFPAGTRFFARIDRFHCECPACGGLIVADVNPRRSQQRDILAKRATDRTGRKRKTERQRARANPDHPYNPFTQVLTCPHCGKVYGVGIILWSFPQGAHTGRQPPDCQPTRRQLAELRSYTVSKWAAMVARAGGEINLAVDLACTCPFPDKFSPECPVHGDPPVDQADRSKE